MYSVSKYGRKPPEAAGSTVRHRREPKAVGHSAGRRDGRGAKAHVGLESVEAGSSATEQPSGGSQAVRPFKPACCAYWWHNFLLTGSCEVWASVSETLKTSWRARWTRYMRCKGERVRWNACNVLWLYSVSCNEEETSSRATRKTSTSRLLRWVE